MLTNVEYDQDTFVTSLVKAVQEMSDNNVKPTKFTIPQTTFNHFKKSIIYEGMFRNQTDWKKRLWNSKYNLINFDKPMFMGLFVDVVPDVNDKDICYLHAESQYRDMKIPFEYSLNSVRRYRIKNNLMIVIKSRARIFHNVPKNEWHAAELLREMITETEFRKYMVHSFILVQGDSGKTYQVFRKRPHVKVWLNGKIVEEVCVNIEDRRIPPTDNVLALKVMIETDEEEFRKLANIYRMKNVA